MENTGKRCGVTDGMLTECRKEKQSSIVHKLNSWGTGESRNQEEHSLFLSTGAYEQNCPALPLRCPSQSCAREVYRQLLPFMWRSLQVIPTDKNSRNHNNQGILHKEWKNRKQKENKNTSSDHSKYTGHLNQGIHNCKKFTDMGPRNITGNTDHPRQGP